MQNDPEGTLLWFNFSTAAGLWSLVVPNPNPGEVHSLLSDHALLLMLVLIHQQAKAQNSYRSALYSFSDEHGTKGVSSFSISLEKLYLTLCQLVDNYCCSQNDMLCSVELCLLLFLASLLMSRQLSFYMYFCKETPTFPVLFSQDQILINL